MEDKNKVVYLQLNNNKGKPKTNNRVGIKKNIIIMKKFLLLFSLASILMSASCENQPSSDAKASAQQEQIAKELAAQTGMPSVKNATMKKQLKMIIEECDKQNLICYAYIIPEMTGRPVLLGKCLGYGIPYATQYTNPEKISRENQYGIATLPQADPDGLFKPGGADGTWLLLIDPATNEPHPVFCEPKVLVTPFKLF